MYHALYALSGDEAWLEHAEDVSRLRWLTRLHAAGLGVLTYFTDIVTDQTVPPGFWEALRGPVADPAVTHLPLLLTIEGNSGFARHVVAVALPVREADPVIVSDSGRDGLLHLTYPEFLASVYGRAYEVEALAPADLELYPFESGAEYASRTDAAPYLM